MLACLNEVTYVIVSTASWFVYMCVDLIPVIPCLLGYKLSPVMYALSVQVQ